MKLRFSIRDLLWLTLVIGLALGWRLDHRRNDRDTKVLEVQGNEALVTERAAPGIFYVWGMRDQRTVDPNEIENWRSDWQTKANSRLP